MIVLIQQKPDFNQYRANVGCIVQNTEGKILYCERADIPDAWQLPQGGIDQEEAPKEAALRELYEETGISQATLQNTYPHWLVYNFPKEAHFPSKGAIKGHFKEHFKGQAQKWFLFKTNQEVIDLSTVLEKEFTATIWATPAHILKTVVPFRKPIYEECFKYFGLV